MCLVFEFGGKESIVWVVKRWYILYEKMGLIERYYKIGHGGFWITYLEHGAWCGL